MSRSSVELITDFLDTLRSLSTGSYLREGEREFWDPPYPPEVAAEVAAVLRVDIRQEPTEMSLAVIAAYGALSALSERHGDAVFEEEEQNDFRVIVSALAAEHNQDGESVLTDLDRITGEDD